MTDYIRRDDAIIKGMEIALGGLNTPLKIKALFDEIPASDVGEVVRCKDCFYWSCGPDEPIWKCNMLSRDDYSVFTSEDAYCQWGRRKEA